MKRDAGGQRRAARGAALAWRATGSVAPAGAPKPIG